MAAAKLRKATLSPERARSCSFRVSSGSKSLDDDECESPDAEEIHFCEEGVNSNFVLRSIVKNPDEEGLINQCGTFLQLNALVKEHTGLQDKGPVRIFVRTNVDEKDIQFTEGFIAFASQTFLWMRFYVRLDNENFEKILYNYLLVSASCSDLTNDERPEFFRELRKGNGLTLRHYDGFIKFHKKGNNEVIESKEKPVKQQNLTAIDYYSEALMQQFLPRFRYSNIWFEMQETWFIILQSVCTLKLTPGPSFPPKNIITCKEDLMKRALSRWYNMVSTNAMPSIDANVFELAITLILIGLEVTQKYQLPLKDCETFLEWICVKEENQHEKLSKLLADRIENLSEICDYLRTSCQKMANDLSTEFTRSSFFPALLNWAYLDGHRQPLKIYNTNSITNDVIFTQKPIYINRSTLKNLLLLAVSSNSLDVQSHLDEFAFLPSVDLLECLSEHYSAQDRISKFILELVEKSFEEDNGFCSDDIEAMMKLTSTLMSVFCDNEEKTAPNLSAAKRIILKRFSHMVLDLLALYDRISEAENSEQEKSHAYELLASIFGMFNFREVVFDSEDVFHWCNLFAHRNGLRPSTKAFLDEQMNRVKKKWFENNKIAEAAPKFCYELPQMVQAAKDQGFRLKNYKNLQNLLEEFVIDSLPQNVDIYHNDIYFSKLLEKVPKIVEAFCSIIKDKFPTSVPKSYLEASIAFIEFEFCFDILKLLRQHQDIVQTILGSPLHIYAMSFREIKKRLETADISAQDFRRIEDKECQFGKCFEILCDENDEKVTKTILSVKTFRDNVINRKNEIDTFRKWAEILQEKGANLNLTVFDDAFEEWTKRPMKNYLRFHQKLQSNSGQVQKNIGKYKFYIEMMESRTFSDICVGVFNQVMECPDTPMPYKQIQSDYLSRIHQIFLKEAKVIVSGPLKLEVAKTKFSLFHTEAEKRKEIDCFFKFCEKYGRSHVTCTKEQRQRQICAVETVEQSWQRVHALNQLVKLLEINADQDVLRSFDKMEKLEELNVCDLEEKAIDICCELAEQSESKIRVIEQFVDKPAFLRWIKMKIQTPQELAFVIELADLSSTDLGNGEERVQDFFNALNGYRPFIYDLSSESTFDDIKEAYQGVFENIKENPKLLEQYTKASKDSAWFERVLETLGSAETKAVDTAVHINEGGTYRIKYDKLFSENDFETLTTQDVVTLDYIPRIKENFDSKESNVSKHCTLNDLKDLYNWLMLIVRKEKPEEALIVDTFERTFHNIETLASLFVSLRHSGCSFFHGWSAVVRTTSPQKTLPVIEVHFGVRFLEPLVSSSETCDFDLSQLCMAMESMKRKWENYVFDMRSNHSALNYFNGQQLRVLCSSLAEPQFTNETALFYLQMLDANISFENVQVILDEYDEYQDQVERNRPDSVCESAENDDIETAEVPVDEVSRMIGTLEALKMHGWNENQAKAALYMTGFTSESLALNWIIDNQDEDDLDFESYSLLFDQHYASLASTGNYENSHTEDGPPVSYLAHNIEKRFDEYLKMSQQNRVGGLINLEQLDFILQRCIKEPNKTNQLLPIHMKNGKPNLVVCKSRAEILPQVLSLYQFIHSDSLPKYTQVLMCSSDTNSEELEVFVLRALKDPNKKVYSMVFADELDVNCANHLENLFEKLRDVERTYKLVVFVHDETSPVVEVLERLHINFAAMKSADALKGKQYKTELVSEAPQRLRNYICENLQTPDSKVDSYSVRLVTSTQPSSGKSLFVSELESKLQQEDKTFKRIIMRLCETKIDQKKCLDVLWKLRLQTKPTIIHIDVSNNVKENVEEFIFSLCILGGIQDNRGQLFVTRKNFLVCVEMLDPAKQGRFAKSTFLLCLPNCHCLSPKQYIQNKSENDTESARFSIFVCETFIAKASFQRPYQYLTLLEKDEDITSHQFNSAETQVDNQREMCKEIIETLTKWSGLQNPTWAQLTYFTQFLNEQLELCECNIFVNDEQFVGFKNFLVKHCIVKMGQDFALPSLSVSDNSPSFGLDDHSVLKCHQIRRRWENNAHPYVFFNADNTTFTFLGVKVENTNLIDSKGNKIAENAMPSSLEVLIRNQAYDQRENILGENFDQLSKSCKLKKLNRVLSADVQSIDRDVDPNYELTQDNVMKLLAIYMRFKCNIPVIIIGETGCGKTRLVEYLCELLAPWPDFPNKKVVKVHGGVTAEDIVRHVKEAEKQAKENSKKNKGAFTVLFFDEANTTEAIHVIKEVVCDFTIRGEVLDPDCGLKIVAACNPYKRHHPKMIEKLETAGLGFHLSPKMNDDKLEDDVPMRHLVYRVNPLPPSLLPLAWDFGRLTEENEYKYTRQIVQRQARFLRLSSADVDFISHVLNLSQIFLRQNEELSLSVSLRHIDRAMKVFTFFRQKAKVVLSEIYDLKKKEKHCGVVPAEPNQLSCLIILTLGVCYYFSLSEERDKYCEEISLGFTGDNTLPRKGESIKRELELCQQVFVNNIQLGFKTTVAKNKALSENVFMMFICIQTKIPLFLVGKPGSSKSLAKTIVMDAMQGKYSNSKFFRNFKQAHVRSFQCSPHTTAEGIVNEFKQASQYQKQKNLESFVSVVVLDEIGLAEASAKMPLKALHPLLEEGYVEQGRLIPAEYSKVAFIGISNWALDPAKMSRGILVSRTVPKHGELLESARAICRVDNEGSGLESLVEPLSKAYEQIYKMQFAKQSKEYFGLRDFYGLLKMLYCQYLQSNCQGLSFLKVCRAICRNFGGKDRSVAKVFIDHCDHLFERSMMLEVLGRMSTLNLVRENIEEVRKRLAMPEEQRRMNNESRYLLLLTENFAALQLLPNVLNVENCEIIFGSSFPQDREYVNVCRNINRIKMCMESGIPVVLLNIGSVYESLYDALNQQYVYYGEKRLVDMGLGSNRVKCSVSENFRLIIIEEEKTAKHYPIPLLNRLEKHYVDMQSILTSQQAEVVQKLKQLMAILSDFERTDIPTERFKTRDVFIGFVEADTAACIVLQAHNSLQHHEKDNPGILLLKSFEKAFQTCTEEAVMRISKKPPVPELAKLFNSPPDFKELYNKQGRKHLSDLLLKQCYSTWEEGTKCRFIEVTTFCGIPSANEIKLRNRKLMKLDSETENENRQFVINLNWMKTEQEFTSKVNEFLLQCDNEKDINATKCLFVTCLKGQKHVSLIACAKYCLENIMGRAKISKLCVVLIIDLPRNWYISNYRSFCMGQWDCFHVDSLLVDEGSESLLKLLYGEKVTLKDLFHVECSSCSAFQKRFIRDVIYETIASSSTETSSSKVVRISNVLQLFDGPEVYAGVEEMFMKQLASFLYMELGQDTELGAWVLDKAASLQDLIAMGSLKEVIYNEFKQRAKPNMSKFLNTINFDNNLRLLFEQKWCKELWINLFSLIDTIGTKYQVEGHSMQLAIEFPFSTYIIHEMDDLLKESKDAVQNQPDLNIQEMFLETLQNDESHDLWKILRNSSIPDEKKIRDAFINDLIIHELNVTAEKEKRDLLKFIRLVVNQRMREMPESNPSFGLAFLVFGKMKSELKFIQPLIRMFSARISKHKFESLTVFIVKNTVESLMHQISPPLKVEVDIKILEFKKQELDFFVENVNLLKSCSKNFQNDEDFQGKLEKLQIFSYCVTEACYLMEDESMTEAGKGAKMLWTSMSSMKREEISSITFIKRLIVSLRKTSEAVLTYCLMKSCLTCECAFCRQDVVETTRKQGFPFSLPCRGSHPVHPECWKMKREEIQASESQQSGLIRCLLCQTDVDDYEFKACKIPTLKFLDNHLSNLWNQSLKNVRKVFLGLMKDYVIPKQDETSIKFLTDYCIIKKSESCEPYFMDKDTRYTLTTMLVKEVPPAFVRSLENVINSDNEKEIASVDIKQTLLLFQTILEVSLFGGFYDAIAALILKGCATFISDMLSIAQIKKSLDTFTASVVQTMPRYTIAVPKQFFIPHDIEKEIHEQEHEVAENVKRLFSQLIFLQGGKALQTRMKRNHSLSRMFPEMETPYADLPFPRDISGMRLKTDADFWNPLPKICLDNFRTEIQQNSQLSVLQTLFDDDFEVINCIKEIPTILNFFRNLAEVVQDGDLNREFDQFVCQSGFPIALKTQLATGCGVYVQLWNNIVKDRLRLLEPDVKCRFEDLLSISSTLRNFLPSKGKTNDCCAYATLFFLVSKNNELIQKHRSCFKIETPPLYLDENAVTKEHVVAIDDVAKELQTLISFFTFTNNEKPTHLVHDFETIQRMFCYKFCAFKPLINPKILKFSEESKLSDALSDARSLGKIKPLSTSFVEKIKQSFTRMPDVCQMLKQVELLMKYLDKNSSGENDTTSLGDFMQTKLRRKSNLGIHGVETSQIVSLWQHLALQKTCLMLEHSGEEPFLGISPKFQDPLKDRLKEQLEELADAKKENLMLNLNEFILVHINDPDSLNPDASIEESLNKYYKERTSYDLKSGALMKFAESVIKFLLKSTGRANIVKSNSLEKAGSFLESA